MLNQPTAAPSSVLAFVTTIHAAMLILRLHRGRMPGVLLLALPSLAFAAMPWVLPTTAGLSAALAAHLAWFVACERLAPPVSTSQAPGSRAGRAAGSASAAGPVPPSPARAGRPAGGFVAVPVLAVREETPAIRTFRFARPDGFSFRAGQFLTIRVEADGRPLTRCYSISSPPEVPGYLEISVRRQGPVSELLHTTIRPGSVVSIGGAAGPFVYPDDEAGPIVFVAGGIGITPLLSMLRHAVTADPSRPVTLLYSVRSPDDLAFGDELAFIARRHPQVRVAVSITGDRVEGYRHGRFDAAAISDLVPDLAHSLFMLCGPLPMIEAVRLHIVGLGVPAGQVRSEAFEAAVAGAANAGGLPEQPATATVTFAASRRVAEAGSGENLLEVAERARVDIPSMCRAGVCGTCRTRLASGDAHCASDLLDESEREAGWLLPCVTYARGDCVLEA